MSPALSGCLIISLTPCIQVLLWLREVLVCGALAHSGFPCWGLLSTRAGRNWLGPAQGGSCSPDRPSCYATSRSHQLQCCYVRDVNKGVGYGDGGEYPEGIPSC